MLIKKKLLQIPPQPCPDIDLPHNPYGQTERKCAVQAVDGIVVVDIYDEEGELIKRFFADGNNWQYYDVTSESWNRRQNYNAYTWGTNEDYYTKDRKIPMEVQKVIGIKPHDHEMLCMYLRRYTENIARLKRLEKGRRVEARIEYMLKRSELTKAEKRSIDRWLLKDVLPAVSMMNPKGKSKKNQIRCLCCGCRRQVSGIRHKDVWTCPKCGRKTTVYEKRYITSRKDKESIAYASPVPGGFAISGADAYRRFDEEGKQIITMVRHSVLYDGEKEKKKMYCSPHGVYGWRFLRDEDMLYGEYVMYTGNVKEAFHDGKYGRVNLGKLEGMKLNVFNLFQGNKRNAEKTFIAGLYGLIGYAASQKRDVESFEDLTKIDQNYITAFRRNNYGQEMMWKVKALHRYYRKKGTYNQEQLTKIEKLSFTTEDMAAAFENMTDTKFINYFSKQVDRHPEKSCRAILDMYADYIEMAELLNNEGIEAIDLTSTFFRFPKDVIEAHDRMEAACDPIMDAVEEERYIRNARRQEKRIIREESGKDRDLKTWADRYSCISQPKGSLEAVFPETVADLVNEGMSLHHCVGWNPVYRERQLTGEYITYFIRKKEDPGKPYFTATYKIEGNKAKFKESYGKEHKLPGKEVRLFIDAFMQNVNAYLQEGAHA